MIGDFEMSADYYVVCVFIRVWDIGTSLPEKCSDLKVRCITASDKESSNLVVFFRQFEEN